MSSELQIQFHNTLSGKKEPFTPLQPGQVKMYVCGITPYDESHLGHARCYVFFDAVKRFFKAAGFEVRHVQNFTDVDDKIIARAQSLKEPPHEVAERYIADYFARMKQLNVLEADAYPRVTQVIPETVRFIERLLDKKLAYPLAGDVMYAVRAFPGYGKLSKRPLDEMESGARVEVDERKKDPLDFALWKRAKPGEPAWDSPWGPGRPGWHIECSVMSTQQLGETFDVHGGGQDLIFPHHENEIAQSEGATGRPFARYWLHNAFVTVNREKMSKSLGNFFTLGAIFEKFSPEVVRFFLLTRHYKSPLDFSDDLLMQAQSGYHTLEDAYESANFLLEGQPADAAVLEEYKQQVFQAMADDFNTEKAVAVLFGLRNDLVERIKKRDLDWIARARVTMRYLADDVLGIRLRSRFTPELLRELQGKVREREEHRKNKDWKKADEARKQLEQSGYLVEDTPAGSVVKPKR